MALVDVFEFHGVEAGAAVCEGGEIEL